MLDGETPSTERAGLQLKCDLKPHLLDYYITLTEIFSNHFSCYVMSTVMIEAVKIKHVYVSLPKYLFTEPHLWTFIKIMKTTGGQWIRRQTLRIIKKHTLYDEQHKMFTGVGENYCVCEKKDI